MATIIVLIVILWIIPWALANSISKAKGRGGQGWILGLFLGWLGVIVVALMPALEPGSLPVPPVRERKPGTPSWWR
jgi:hypothetical protein